MIAKIPLSVRKTILFGAFGLAGILCWWSIRAALADHYAEMDTLDGYKRATQLEPGNAKYWDLRGHASQENLEQPDVKSAIEFYRISLSLDPLSATSWLDLASAYESGGDVAAARTAYLQAKHVYPSSPVVAWSYGNFLLRQGESAAAVIEIHSAVEANPQLGLEAFLICRHFEPNVDLLLDRVLAPIPSIYTDVLWKLAQDRDTATGLKVWSKLIALHPKLSRREVFEFVYVLLQERHEAEALRVWKEATPLMEPIQLKDPPDSLIWDGGFETDITGGGFAWHFEPSRTTKIGYDSLVRHSGMRALRLDFSMNNNSEFAGVCQSVVLEPNATYEFSAWLRTRDLAKDGGIFFRLTYSDDQTVRDKETPKVGGTHEWTKVSAKWNSSDQLQVSRVCLWRSPGLEPIHSPAAAWVDDVSLLKLSTSTN